MSPELVIVEARDADFADLLAGKSPDAAPDTGVIEVAPPEVMQMLRALAERIRPQLAPSAWMIVEERRVLGLCSQVREPEDGIITIGYGVAPEFWGRRVATRAVARLIEWARSDPRVEALAAETAADNIASQRVLENNAFVRTGARVDEEDGPLICWRIATS